MISPFPSKRQRSRLPRRALRAEPKKSAPNVYRVVVVARRCLPEMEFPQGKVVLPEKVCAVKSMVANVRERNFALVHCAECLAYLVFGMIACRSHLRRR